VNLKQWASSQGISYATARRWFDAGTHRLSGRSVKGHEDLPGGRLIVIGDPVPHRLGRLRRGPRPGVLRGPGARPGPAGRSGDSRGRPGSTCRSIGWWRSGRRAADAAASSLPCWTRACRRSCVKGHQNRPGRSGGGAWWILSTDCFHSPVHRKSHARTVVDEPVGRRARGKLPRPNPCGRPRSGLDISYRDRRTDTQGGETRTTRRAPGFRSSRITADRLSGETPGAADDDAGVCTDRTVDRKRSCARETR
jgi:hypothetical protein